MARWASATLLSIFCILVSLAVLRSIDMDAESCTRDAESHDEFTMLQLPEMRASKVTWNISHHQDAEIADLLDQRESNNSALPLSLLRATCGVLGCLACLIAVHRGVTTSFQTSPATACLLFFILLTVFLCTMVPALWRLAVDETCHAGTGQIVCCHVALIIVGFTPVLLVQSNPSLPDRPDHAADECSRAEALIYIIFVAVQIAASLPVFQAAKIGTRLEIYRPVSVTHFVRDVARLRGGPDPEDDIAQPLMIILIYLALSWCSFCSLYERMVPGRSFLADFPDLILHQAFPSIIVKPIWRVRTEQVKLKMSKIRAGVDAISVQRHGQAKEVANQLSSVITNLRNDLVPEDYCVLTGVRSLQKTIAADGCGRVLHFLFYFIYGVFTEVYNIMLILRITYMDCHDDSVFAMLLYPFVAFPVMFLAFAMLTDFVEDSLFSSGATREEALDVTNISNLTTRRSVTRCDADYLARLWKLQWEIEDRIVQKVGHPGTLGQDHPQLLSSRENLANILFKRGDFAAARKVHNQVVEVRSRVLGLEHPDTLTSKEALAADLMGLKKVHLAAQLYREVLTIRSRTQGAEHPDTLSTKFRWEQCTSR